MGGQTVGNEEQPMLEAKRAPRRDLLDQEVPRILLRGERARIGARGGLVVCGGRLPSQAVVGPFLIVFGAEVIEGALLGGRIGPRRVMGRRFPSHA